VTVEHDTDPRNWRSINLANWNSRVGFHEVGYGLDAFHSDPGHLSDVVRFDLPRLPALTGQRGVHLQCHIGTDTLSLARIGAQMSGLDFSAPALDVARRLASDCGADIDYRVADLYDAVDAFADRTFDFVYTGIGALCWLPDIAGWARTVAALLRPGGFLFIREAHPVTWAMSDPRSDDLLVVQYPYFEHSGLAFVEPKTYVEHDDELSAPVQVVFNHGLAEIFNALWHAGLHIELFEEHRSLPWNALGDVMVDIGGGEWALRTGTDRLPLSYTLRAVRR
jgi:SAM-dependent methyltransferase